jgi:cell division protein FtsB
VKVDGRYLRVRREPPFWNKTTKIIFVVVLVGCAVGVVIGDYGLFRIVQLRGERAQLEREIAVAKMRKSLLEDEKDKLENDPLTLERLARERAGLYKPGEKIFVFDEGDSGHAGEGDIPLDTYSLNR